MREAFYRWTRITTAVALAIVFLLILLFAAQAGSSSQTTLAETAHDVHRLDDLLSIDGAYHGALTDLERIDAFECLVGKRLTVIKIWQFFHNGDFWQDKAQDIDDRGAVEFLSVDPTIHVHPSPGITESLDLSTCAVLSRAHDDTIKTFARHIGQWGRPMLLSFAGEMNGNWAGWSGAKNFGPDCSQTYTETDDLFGYYGCTDPVPECLDGPERYRDMYRHFYNIFKDEGVTNVFWVWVVNHESIPGEDWNVASNYYPGDDYIDVISVDGYNWGDDGPGGCPVDAGWKTFDQIFGPILTSVSNTHSSTKPLMIGEFASVEGTDPMSKANWITDAYGKIKSDWPQIKAVVWYNLPGECNFAITSSPESLQAYRNAIADPHYIGERKQCSRYLPLVSNKWACFVDEFDGDELDPDKWEIVTGTVTVTNGKLILSNAEIRSKRVFTDGVLQAKIESSDWNRQDQFTDSSFGFERWYESCHHGATFKPSGHLAVLQNSNCPAQVEAYPPLAGWGDAIERVSAFYQTLTWGSSGVTLRLSDCSSYNEVVTSTLAPTVPLNIRLNAYWEEPHPTETFAIDYIRVCPSP
jgi:hypothetical protein